MKKIALYYVMTLVLVAAFLGGGTELFVRAFIDDGMQFDLEMWKYARQLKFVSENATLGHEHRAGGQARLMGVDVTINNHRLRGPDTKLEPPRDKIRILMLGDSITFGWGVAEDNTVARLLEKRLAKSGHPAEVINAGVGNYNTDMEVEYFLKTGRRFKPDIVVLNFYVNDPEITPAYGHQTFLDRHSYAYVYLRSRLDLIMRQTGVRRDWKRYLNDLFDPEFEGWKVASRRIDEFAAAARQGGMKALLVYYPDLHELGNYPFQQSRQMLESAASKNGLGFLDLVGAVRGHDEPSLWVSPTDAHPNAIATKKFAAAIMQKLKSLGWLS